MPMSKAMVEAYKAKDKAKYKKQAEVYQKGKAKANAITSARRVSAKETQSEPNSK